MPAFKEISDLVISEGNEEQDGGGAFQLRTAADSGPRLPPSTRPPPPWSRRARSTPLLSSTICSDNVSYPRKIISQTTASAQILLKSPNAKLSSSGLATAGVQRREVYLGFNYFEHARAHWFLYIPSTKRLSSGNDKFSQMGKVIQVTGNPFTGFGFQIKLNHNAIQQPDTHYLLLGSLSVPPNVVVEDYTPDPLSDPKFRDHPVPGDRLEEIAFDLGLPYRDASAALPPPGDPVWLKPHPQFERCQEWMRTLIGRYVGEGLLPLRALDVPNKAISVGLRFLQTEDSSGTGTMTSVGQE